MKNNCPLVHKENNDFILKKDRQSVWIAIDGLSVYVKRIIGGVGVDIFTRNKEAGPALDSAQAFDPSCSRDKMIDDMIDTDYCNSSREELYSEIKKYKYEFKNDEVIRERWEDLFGGE